MKILNNLGIKIKLHSVYYTSIKDSQHGSQKQWLGREGFLLLDENCAQLCIFASSQIQERNWKSQRLWLQFEPLLWGQLLSELCCRQLRVTVEKWYFPNPPSRKETDPPSFLVTWTSPWWLLVCVCLTGRCSEEREAWERLPHSALFSGVYL